MQIVSISAHKRIIRWCDPKFVNGEQRVEFALSSILQIAPDGQTWETVPEASRTGYKTLHLDNTTKVDADGVIAESGTGFYDWILGMTAAEAGITAPATDVVFEKIASMIETFLTDNNLWE